MSQEKPIEILLFHADWCGHCQKFMPTWTNMINDKKATKNINFVSYRDDEIDGLPENITQMYGKNFIEGYPTIRINIRDDSYNYMGQREPREIYKFIIEKMVPQETVMTQMGGKHDKKKNSDKSSEKEDNGNKNGIFKMDIKTYNDIITHSTKNDKDDSSPIDNRNLGNINETGQIGGHLRMLDRIIDTDMFNVQSYSVPEF